VEPVAETSENAPPRSIGHALAAERERQGLSRADVAQRLHMSAYQVEAIETGDFSRLPKGTFLRGFVRNYAKVLGIPPEPLLPLLAEGVAGDKKPGIVVPTQNIRFDPMSERLQNPYVKAFTIAAVIVSLAFAAMYWWLFIRPTPPGHAAAARKPAAEAPPSVETPAAKPPETIAKAPPPPEPAKADAGRKAEGAKADAAKADAAKLESAKADAAKADSAKKAADAAKKSDAVKVAAAADGATLKFRFKGESWVEIRDAKGRLLLSRLNAAGSEAEVSGKPPFNVVVGNAPEVQLFYNDHEFALEPHTKVAVARFTVE
jgi:cytoskeleton protein RodZ